MNDFSRYNPFDQMDGISNRGYRNFNQINHQNTITHIEKHFSQKDKNELEEIYNQQKLEQLLLLL